MTSKDDVRMLELELTGTCNLKCPLCVRENPNFKDYVISNQRPLKDIIKQLDTFKNLTDMCLAGIMSEPTHYNDLIPLLVYLEDRGIQTEMYINGNTKTTEWWDTLGQILKCTKVIFTVCGSTQELHEKYRVNSSLEQIYKNAEAFRSSGNKNDYIQLIKFNYNNNDICENRDIITKSFNNIIEINSLPYQERFNINSNIKMTDELTDIYTRIQNSTKNRNTKIQCKSIKTKFISIDQFGNENPCFLYKLFTDDKFNYDFSDILDNKYEFCYECDKMNAVILEINDIELMA